MNTRTPTAIAILEDNLDRRAAMQRWLNDQFSKYQQVYFDDAGEMVAWLENFRDDCIVIGLDHDLELKPTSDGRWADPGDGRMVADYLAKLPPLCPVLVHSSNTPAADGMVAALHEASWQVDAVRPYADLLWIDESWWPNFRCKLLEAEIQLTKTEP